MLVNHSTTDNRSQSSDQQIANCQTPPQSARQPLSVPTLLEQLHRRAMHQPNRMAYQFLADQPASVADSALTVWTYRELFWQTQQVAESLIATFDGQLSGERVLLIYPPGLALVSAFLGCLSVGAIAVPVPPPRRHESLSRWQHILADAQVTGILTTQTLVSELKPLIDASGLREPALKWVVTDADSVTKDTSLFADTENQQSERQYSQKQQSERSHSQRDNIAFLQYTSGSTGQPKGVMVTHANLAHNLHQIQQAFGHSEQTRCVIWLPPYHDMGLIGGILQPLYGGYPVTLMSPASFLRRPARWLEAITHFGGTTSGGPNFAYDYCVRKITSTDRSDLDLSS